MEKSPVKFLIPELAYLKLISQDYLINLCELKMPSTPTPMALDLDCL